MSIISKNGSIGNILNSDSEIDNESVGTPSAFHNNIDDNDDTDLTVVPFSISKYKNNSLTKRARRSYNCGPCKRLKIKCDMKVPCGKCIKYSRTEVCLQNPPNPPTNEQLKLKRKRRLKYLEKKAKLNSLTNEIIDGPGQNTQNYNFQGNTFQYPLINNNVSHSTTVGSVANVHQTVPHEFSQKSNQPLPFPPSYFPKPLVYLQNSHSQINTPACQVKYPVLIPHPHIQIPSDTRPRYQHIYDPSCLIANTHVNSQVTNQQYIPKQYGDGEQQPYMRDPPERHFHVARNQNTVLPIHPPLQINVQNQKFSNSHPFPLKGHGPPFSEFPQFGMGLSYSNPPQIVQLPVNSNGTHLSTIYASPFFQSSNLTHAYSPISVPPNSILKPPLQYPIPPPPPPSSSLPLPPPPPI